MNASTYPWVGFRRRRPGPAGLPPSARIYLIQILTAAAAAAVVAAAGGAAPRWTLLSAILVGAALAQLAAFPTRGNQLFHTGLAFTVAAAVVLPPLAIVAVCLAQHFPDWLRRRYPWYIQAFNIANYILNGLAAWATFHILQRNGAGDARWGALEIAAAAAAGAVFVLSNHVLLARMLRLARGHSRRSTGLFDVDGLTTDLGLASIGIALAVALTTEPAAALLAVFPLILIHRTFSIPALKAQALHDEKTSLLNSRGLESHAASELARARRFGRPLSLILADVDNLREINNRDGHLAGDEALRTIAGALRAELRDYDICARFGGDEFVVVLPETDRAGADRIAARIADRVTRTGSRPRSVPALSASFGVATLTGPTTTLEQLLEQADAAMYVTKNERNAARPERSDGRDLPPAAQTSLRDTAPD